MITMMAVLMVMISNFHLFTLTLRFNEYLNNNNNNNYNNNNNNNRTFS